MEEINTELIFRSLSLTNGVFVCFLPSGTESVTHFIILNLHFFKIISCLGIRHC